jgi:DNA-binding transcriptional LysR family regulator
VENLSALLAVVAAGKGVTLAPAEVSQLAHPQAVFIPLTAPVPSVISAAAQRKDDANALVKELLSCCRDTQNARRFGERAKPETKRGLDPK